MQRTLIIVRAEIVNTNYYSLMRQLSCDPHNCKNIPTDSKEIYLCALTDTVSTSGRHMRIGCYAPMYVYAQRPQITLFSVYEQRL